MAAYNYYGQSYGNPYNGYYPQGYQAAPMVQPQIQQPQQVQTPNQIPVQSYFPAINQSGIIWISGESEATMYPVAPNSAVALWDRNGKAIYLKQADATGKPTMRIYDLVERAENASNSGSASDVNLPAYATKDDLKTIVGAVKGLDELIDSIKADIDTMKGDLYGVAGRKKTTKKAEAMEDDA